MNISIDGIGILSIAIFIAKVFIAIGYIAIAANLVILITSVIVCAIVLTFRIISQISEWMIALNQWMIKHFYFGFFGIAVVLWVVVIFGVIYFS